MPITVVEGWTDDLDFVCEQDGQPKDLSGGTVELLLFDKTGTEITEAGTLSIQDAPNGVVRYEPDAGDLLLANSPLYARVKFTTAGGKDSFYPSNCADVWTVTPVSGKT